MVLLCWSHTQGIGIRLLKNKVLKIYYFDFSLAVLISENRSTTPGVSNPSADKSRARPGKGVSQMRKVLNYQSRIRLVNLQVYLRAEEIEGTYSVRCLMHIEGSLAWGLEWN